MSWKPDVVLYRGNCEDGFANVFAVRETMTAAQYLIFGEANNAYVGTIAPFVRDPEIAKRFTRSEAERICLVSRTFNPAGRRQVMQPAPECIADAPAAA